MGLFKLPAATSCTCAVLGLLSAAYLASVEPQAPNEDLRNVAFGECIVGADDRCNDRHLGSADEQSFIQVLSKIVKPSRGSQSPKGKSLVEKEASKEKPEDVRHPLWKPEWHRMLDRGSLTAGAALFIGGVICTAGGIGGGGIYVTVLMFFGELSVHDAIPMSKVVVFAASLPSLILNLSKSIVLEEGSAAASKSLIDYNVCRVVIPWALIGTLLGVYFNTVLNGQLIVGMLCVILISMTAMISRKGYEQHCEEAELEEKALRESGGESPQDANHSQIPNSLPQPKLSDELRPSLRDRLTANDLKLAAGGLFLVIYSGTVRYHSIQCLQNAAECKHPIAEVVSLGQFEHMSASLLQIIGRYAICVPMLLLVVAATYYSNRCVRSEDDWSWGRVVPYSIMAVITGMLAGLVGIGGGLIFAPFFIQMAMDPHVAVATSSTCVIFTSSSTTFQYLLSDRIIVALIFSFGIPHLLAAYTGTKLVHFIQDNYGTKKSYITWIVAFGVAVSTGLAMQKFMARDTAVH